MAFAASVVWEVNSGGADGTSGNGGGFDPVSGTPGTDYSLLTPITYTDLVIDATTNTNCTSAGHPFDSTHVGNIIAISSGTGFTVQRVQIMSVASNVATCDKSLGTLGSTAGHGILGGALASPGQAAALKIASNTVFIKNSGGASPTVYLMTNSSNVAGGKVSDSGAASGSAPSYWIGYESTRTVVNTDTNRPICKANANSVTCFTFSGNNIIARNIDAGNNGAFTSVGGFSVTGAQCRLERAVASNCTGTGIAGSAGSTKLVYVAADTCGTGISVAASHLSCFVAKNCTGGGITIGNTGDAEFGIVSGTAGPGVNTTSNLGSIRNVTVYGSTGGSGDGVKFNAGFANNTAINVISYGNSQKNFNLDSGDLVNKLFNCASGSGGVADSVGTTQKEGMITLTADPFVASGSADFRLNTTAGGGALLRAQAFPTAYLGYLGVANASDVGAYQHADPAGSALSNVMVVPCNRIIID